MQLIHKDFPATVRACTFYDGGNSELPLVIILSRIIYFIAGFIGLLFLSRKKQVA